MQPTLQATTQATLILPPRSLPLQISLPSHPQPRTTSPTVTMGTSIVTARAALDILRASTTVLSPAHITGILAARHIFYAYRKSCAEEQETLRVLRSLQAELAAVLEGQHQAATTQASGSAAGAGLTHPQLLPSLLEYIVMDARRRQLSSLALVSGPKQLGKTNCGSILWRISSLR